MTYGKLKQKILSLLDLKTETGVQNGSVYDAVISSMASAVDSVGRKIASSLKNLIKRTAASFSADGDLVKTAVPAGFIALRYVLADGKNYSPSLFFVSDGYIVGSGVPIGAAEICYYSYPDSVENLSDSSATDYDGTFFDLISYGAALELCTEAYPGDFSRYAALATEYDERMAGAFISGTGGRVENELYGKRSAL